MKEKGDNHVSIRASIVLRRSSVAGFGRTQHMIRTDRWKLIHYPRIARFQLFDLAADPHEVNDLAADSNHAAVVADLRAKLEAWQKQSGDPLVKHR